MLEEIKGTLYLKDGVFGGILPLDTTTRADFQVDQTKDRGMLHVHMKFFAPDSQDDVLGEVGASFFGRDPVMSPVLLPFIAT